MVTWSITTEVVKITKNVIKAVDMMYYYRIYAAFFGLKERKSYRFECKTICVCVCVCVCQLT